MRPSHRSQVRVTQCRAHLRAGEQSDLVAAMLGEFAQDLQFHVSHGGDVGAGFGRPEAGRLSCAQPPGAGMARRVLDDVSLTSEAGVAEVLDGGAHGTIGAVDDADGTALLVSQESGGESEDAGPDDDEVRSVGHGSIMGRGRQIRATRLDKFNESSSSIWPSST